MRIAIDLFAGAGGLSLGLTRAGFTIVAAVEINKHASSTYKKNHKNLSDLCFNEDIRNLKPHKFLDRIGIYKNEIDLIAGGPPCQGFSMANGRSRLISNPKNEFVHDFVRWIEQIKPRAFLMENVKGFEQIDGGALVNDLLQRFIEIGYRNTIKLSLDAVNYGVPQHRKRIFLIGTLNGELLLEPAKLYDNKEKRFLTVGDAIIGDLPKIHPLPGENVTKYYNEPQSKYQKKIRGKIKTLHNHITTNCDKKIIEKFSWIKQGENWTAIKDRIGIKVQYSSLYKRLDEEKPSITMSNYRKSMIIHPRENRLLSVREAARLQSFPDNYIFEGGISSMQQQVGDAVPPLLAKEVAKIIIESL